jgi:hypothetical protein
VFNACAKKCVIDKRDGKLEHQVVKIKGSCATSSRSRLKGKQSKESNTWAARFNKKRGVECHQNEVA